MPTFDFINTIKSLVRNAAALLGSNLALFIVVATAVISFLVSAWGTVSAWNFATDLVSDSSVFQSLKSVTENGFGGLACYIIDTDSMLVVIELYLKVLMYSVSFGLSFLLSVGVIMAGSKIKSLIKSDIQSIQ